MSTVRAPREDAATERWPGVPAWSGVAGGPVLITSTETSEESLFSAKPGPPVVPVAFPVFS